jgi:hypothetical protein
MFLPKLLLPAFATGLLVGGYVGFRLGRWSKR